MARQDRGITMTGVSRRGFVAGSAGALAGYAGTAAAQEQVQRLEQARAQVADLDLADTQGGPVLGVDRFGAVGDCPRTGSTAAGTDDTDAIEAALRACPEGGTVRFSPGKCYMVSRPVEVTGKALVIDARGAMIRCGDDSVWHVFTFGGRGPAALVDEITVRGGTWDGNLAHQRYWPNQARNVVPTELGLESAATRQGRPFYENSPVNGLDWKEGWLDGSAGDRVFVNGKGNDGLVRVQHTARVRFVHCAARDYVRNGFVAWNCADSLFLDCNSEGQLATTYFELKALFGRGYEAAFIKVVGHNSDAHALRGMHAQTVRVIGGRVIGGAMPVFVRIQGQKPISSGCFCHIDGLEAYGIARELWFEDCASVRISNSAIVCAAAETSAYRNDPAIFFSNRTHDWVLSNCYIRGRIDTNQNQDRRFGAIEACILECEAPIEDWLVQCDTISGSVIRSAGWGAQCRTAVGSEFLAEANASLFVTGTARGCRVGVPRRTGPVQRFALEAGQTEIPLPEAPEGLNHLRIRNPGVMGGRWFEIHKANFRLKGDRLRLESSEGPFRAQAGDEVELAWYGAGAGPAPYAGIRCGPGEGASAVEIDVRAENIRASRVRGATRVQGQFSQIPDETVFAIDDGASLELSGLTVRRCAGTIVACQRQAVAPRLVIRNCWFEDWGILGDALPRDDLKRPLARVAVSELLQLTQTTFLRTAEGGGHFAPGTSKGPVPILILGDNVYAGGTRPARIEGLQVLQRPDFAE
jgi:hypothetical protein